VLLDAKTGNHPVTATSSVKTENVSYAYSGITIPAKKITVTISWSDNGKNGSVSLSHVLTYGDIN
jgi:hypothetical protein